MDIKNFTYCQFWGEKKLYALVYVFLKKVIQKEIKNVEKVIENIIFS